MCWGRKWQGRTGVGRAKGSGLGAMHPPKSRVRGCPSHGHHVLLCVCARWASEALVRSLEEALDLYELKYFTRVYITSRPGSFQRQSLQWLSKSPRLAFPSFKRHTIQGKPSTRKQSCRFWNLYWMRFFISFSNADLQQCCRYNIGQIQPTSSGSFWISAYLILKELQGPVENNAGYIRLEH